MEPDNGTLVATGPGKQDSQRTAAKSRTKMTKADRPASRKSDIKGGGRAAEAALLRQRNKEELQLYQAELIKLQSHLERTGRKLIILFDGRDPSGKGGNIRRVTRYMNAKHYRIIALGKPTRRSQPSCT